MHSMTDLHGTWVFVAAIERIAQSTTATDDDTYALEEAVTIVTEATNRIVVFNQVLHAVHPPADTTATVSTRDELQGIVRRLGVAKEAIEARIKAAQTYRDELDAAARKETERVRLLPADEIYFRAGDRVPEALKRYGTTRGAARPELQQRAALTQLENLTVGRDVFDLRAMLAEIDNVFLSGVRPMIKQDEEYLTSAMAGMHSVITEEGGASTDSTELILRATEAPPVLQKYDHPPRRVTEQAMRQASDGGFNLEDGVDFADTDRVGPDLKRAITRLVTLHQQQSRQTRNRWGTENAPGRDIEKMYRDEHSELEQFVERRTRAKAKAASERLEEKRKAAEKRRANKRAQIDEDVDTDGVDTDDSADEFDDAPTGTAEGGINEISPFMERAIRDTHRHTVHVETVSANQDKLKAAVALRGTTLASFQDAWEMPEDTPVDADEIENRHVFITATTRAISDGDVAIEALKTGAETTEALIVEKDHELGVNLVRWENLEAGLLREPNNQAAVDALRREINDTNAPIFDALDVLRALGDAQWHDHAMQNDHAILLEDERMHVIDLFVPGEQADTSPSEPNSGPIEGGIVPSESESDKSDSASTDSNSVLYEPKSDDYEFLAAIPTEDQPVQLETHREAFATADSVVFHSTPKDATHALFRQSDLNSMFGPEPLALCPVADRPELNLALWKAVRHDNVSVMALLEALDGEYASDSQLMALIDADRAISALGTVASGDAE